MKSIEIPLSHAEYEVLKVLSKSLSIREISRYTGLPYIKVYRALSNLRKKANIRSIFDIRKTNLILVNIICEKDKDVVSKKHFFEIYKAKIASSKGLYLKGYLVPCKYVDLFYEEFKGRILDNIKGLDYIFWVYDPKFIKYDAKRKILKADLDGLIEYVEKDNNKIDKIECTDFSPDKIDMALILLKYNNMFRKIYPLYKKLAEEDKFLPLVSKQVLSYHLREHVLKNYWKFNTLFFKLGYNLDILYLKGYGVYEICSSLIKIPIFWLAIVEERKCLLFGTIINQYMQLVEKVIERFELSKSIEMSVWTIGGMKISIPKLWRYIIDKKWI